MEPESPTGKPESAGAGSEPPTGDPVAGFVAVLPTILEGLPVAVFVLDTDGTPVYANPAARRLLGKGADPSVHPGQLAATYEARLAGTDDAYPAERMPIVRALAGESTTVSDMEIHRPDGVVPVEVWAAPVTASGGEVRYAVAVFQDIGARRRAEAEAGRLHEENVRQSGWLAAVREVQFSVLSGADLDTALELVVLRARELIPGDEAIIGIPGGEGLLEIRAAEGDVAMTLRGMLVSLEQSIMGEVIDMDAAAVLDDAACHGDISDPVVQLDFGPSLFVPLSGNGRAFGSLCVARHRGQPLFTENDVAAAEAFANQAALAVRIGEAQSEIARLAVVQEREEVADDLRRHPEGHPDDTPPSE